MAKLGFWMILLFIFAFIFAVGSLSFSIWVYSKGYGLKISAHSSSEANIGLFVEGSGSFCGDSLCNGAETCSTCSADCGTCAGTSGASSGGGGGGAQSYNFIVVDDEFNIKMVSGDSQTNEAIIKNTGTKVITLSIEVTGIKEYIYLNANSLTIRPGQSAPLTFTVNAPEPGVYAGKIILTYQGITREILIIVNVVSEGVLFDTSITLPELYRIVGLGQRLPAIIEIVEIGGKTKVDVTVNYLIKDFVGKTRFTETETFNVFGMKKFNKMFYTNGLEQGDYVLGIEVIYQGGFATSSTPFSISSEGLFKGWITLGVLLMAIIFIVLLVLFIRRHDEDKDFKLKEGVK